jgi:hypothetical protein
MDNQSRQTIYGAMLDNWRRQVFERDNHTCQICGRQGYINAHHMDGWGWCVARRFDVTNGVTLCAGKNGCHEKFHRKYGRGRNTEKQFKEFKASQYKGASTILWMLNDAKQKEEGA